MANTCNDINGNPINQFVFQEDGVVYGVVNYDGAATNYGTTIPYSGEGDLVNITSECCSGMGFTYNSGEGKCYYREVCSVDNQVKVVFNVNENNGLIFNPTDGECGLNLKFDYLVEYDSSDIYEKIQSNNKNVVDILKGLTISVLIEKMGTKDSAGDGIYFENNQTLISVFEQPIYAISDFTQETGVILSGDFVNIVNNKLQNELGNQYSPNIMDSHWLTADISIDNPNVISQIVDQEVKFSLLIQNNECDLSVIMDNIELNKVCEKQYIERKTIDKSPSFNMVKTIDNKKSWVELETQREHLLPIRETYYETDSDKMILNTKEIELSTSIYNAIEQDIIAFMQENGEIMGGKTSSGELWDKDITNLLSTDITTLKSISAILKTLGSELIDVKSRKTLIGYPVLNMIHERYMASENSNKYDYSKLSDFVGMLGDYWVDLIEQVIPATTIWGSTNKVGTTIFRPNKFRYKNCNIQYGYKVEDKFAFCGNVYQEGDTVEVVNTAEVVVKEITQLHPVAETKSKLYINNFSNGSETLGRVSILGIAGNNTTTNISEG